MSGGDIPGTGDPAGAWPAPDRSLGGLNRVSAPPSPIPQLPTLQPATTQSATTGTFHVGSVRTVGIVGLVIGAAIFGAGMGMAVVLHQRWALPIGIAVGILGLLIGISSLGRVTSTLEVHFDHISWRWGLATHALDLDDLVDASLVEKGSPSSGSSWAGFLAGGIDWVFLWWFFDWATALFRSDPVAGTSVLVVVKRYGGPVPIPAISGWSSGQSHRESSEALFVVQSAIRAASARKVRRGSAQNG